MRLPAAAFGAMFAAACSSHDDTSPNDAGPLSCGFNCQDVVVDQAPLVTIRSILSVTCANSDGCHGGGAGHLPMPSPGVFSSLIDVASFEIPSLLRVKPGDPANSYLYRKVACDAGPIVMSCMPPGAPLSPALVQAFHDWIEAGAPTQ